MSSKTREEYEGLTNEELVKLSQSGDQEARGVLCGRFLNTRFMNVNNGYLDRDDVIQEGLMGLLRAIDTYKFSRGVPFDAYALVCIRNSIKTALGGDFLEIPVGIGSSVPEVTDKADDPLKKIIVAERLKEVLDACDDTLSDIEKTVIFLKAGEMSYEEIGERLKMSPKSVDNAIQRGRKKLKKVCSDEKN